MYRANLQKSGLSTALAHSNSPNNARSGVNEMAIMTDSSNIENPETNIENTRSNDLP